MNKYVIRTKRVPIEVQDNQNQGPRYIKIRETNLSVHEFSK